MKILVTSASWSAAYVVLQGLACAGHEVWLADDNPYAAAFYSRYASGRVVLPPESSEKAFIQELLKSISTHNFECVIPISDLATEFISRYRREFEGRVLLNLPDEKLVSLARHKDQAYRFAEEKNIRIPKTYFPKTLSDVQSLAGLINFPCVIKQTRGTGNKGNVYVRTAEELISIYPKVAVEGLWPVIQEFVKGDFYGFVGLAHQGVVVDGFMYMAKASPDMQPVAHMGLSVCDEALWQTVQQIISITAWSGPINIDFIKDNLGQFLFLEINPRLSGSLVFSKVAGVDLAVKYLQMAKGKDFEGKMKPAFRPGIRFRFILPIELVHTIKHPGHLGRLFMHLLDPCAANDIPWSDLNVVGWHLRHLWWNRHAIRRGP